MTKTCSFRQKNKLTKTTRVVWQGKSQEEGKKMAIKTVSND